MTPNEDFGPAVVKATPAVGGWVLSGLTLNDWVAVATLLYLALQIVLLVPRYLRWWRGKEKNDGK
ncbi:hypothetical protein FNU76_10155 [Chitinimonas arctica]|uniref:Phage holin T7 family, holin superfamily II n=1 Tax=Chitinimonas arctica TaxID=2594795 RepID=A0A516SEW3_9NEIS|nr:hypothetical protein [Chitinimonas arctica]QDQ26696.1 hypothetical protein FNU76_10155 [Chitinimonas arctica]